MNSKALRIMNKTRNIQKWETVDWFILVAELLAPLISLLCVFFINNKDYNETAKLATLVSAITIQIVLVDVHQKILKDRAKTIQQSIDNLKNEVRPTENMAKILSSGHKKRVSFALRRLSELDEIMKYTAIGSETELLSVPVYYDELNHLSEMVLNDRDATKCEIWAMTGFSDLEWDNKSNDLESEWTETLTELTEKYTTNRVCIIDTDLSKLLKQEKSYYDNQMKEWKAASSGSVMLQQLRLKSFYDYIEAYYAKNNKNKYKVNNYALKNTSKAHAELIKAKGFFGILLSNGDKYVIKGEAVNPTTGLQGQFVFDEDDILKLYNLHKKACEKCTTLDAFIQSEETSQGFKDFIKNNGISF